MDQDFGKHLQKARTDRGLSIEDAATGVRIRSTFLRALESSDLTKFPNAAYAKSFLVMYGKFLGVDVKSVAAQIDTTTQMKVEGYQYLTNRAAAQPKTKPDPELTFSAAPTAKSNGSWLPLFVLGGTVVAVVVGFVIWQNVNRLSDRPQSAPAKTSPTPSSATAVEPLTPPPAPKPATPAPSTPGPEASAPPAPEPAPPRTAIISVPDAAPNAVGEIPRARPISPVAAIAATDSDVLADLSPPKPRVISPPPAAAQPAPPPALLEEEASVTAVDPDATVLDARRKTWVIVRTGPGGQSLFEDFIYPGAKPLRLPKGRYFIELRDAEAVEITHRSQRVGYSPPGVLLE